MAEAGGTEQKELLGVQLEHPLDCKFRRGTHGNLICHSATQASRLDDMTSQPSAHQGSKNIFADIGLPYAGEHLIKAQLVVKIDNLMKARKLRQVDAAELFGVKQPDISKMLRGDFRQFSVERLMRFLVALGQDVEIVVRERSGTKKAPSLHVV